MLALGGIAFAFSLLFKLSDVISAILAMRILVQFIGQGVGLLLLRRQNKNEFPNKMPLFPVPVYIAIAMWVGILVSTGYKMVAGGLTVIGLGIIVYYVKGSLEKKGKENY